jgi:hypothetical protein
MVRLYCCIYRQDVQDLLDFFYTLFPDETKYTHLASVN